MINDTSYQKIIIQPNIDFKLKVEVYNEEILKDEDGLNRQQIKEMNDFLTLKPV